MRTHSRPSARAPQRRSRIVEVGRFQMARLQGSDRWGHGLIGAVQFVATLELAVFHGHGMLLKIVSVISRQFSVDTCERRPTALPTRGILRAALLHRADDVDQHTRAGGFTRFAQRPSASSSRPRPRALIHSALPACLLLDADELPTSNVDDAQSIRIPPVATRMGKRVAVSRGLHATPAN